MTEAEILEDFSELTSEDIKACLNFAADREKKLQNNPLRSLAESERLAAAGEAERYVAEIQKIRD